jgi:hypothetical protein
VNVGDLVKVNSMHGDGRIGVIIKPWGHALGNAAWVVAFRDHKRQRTIASECDMEVINESR